MLGFGNRQNGQTAHCSPLFFNVVGLVCRLRRGVLPCSAAPTAAQGRVTSPWCGGETKGGHPWANTQSGGRPIPAAAAGSQDHAPHSHGPPWGTTMVQGALHRGGGGVSEGVRVSLWPSPPLGLSFPPFPQPMHTTCSAQVHHGLVDRILGHGGYRSLRGARLGQRELRHGGVKGGQRRG